MTENQVYEYLRKNSPRPASWSRIETWTQRGVADVTWAVDGYGEGFLELKVSPGLDLFTINLDSFQYGWLRSRHKAGGRVAVLTYLCDVKPGYFVAISPDSVLFPRLLKEKFTFDHLFLNSTIMVEKGPHCVRKILENL